jgi:hypothetical protein
VGIPEFMAYAKENVVYAYLLPKNQIAYQFKYLPTKHVEYLDRGSSCCGL